MLSLLVPIVSNVLLWLWIAGVVLLWLGTRQQPRLRRRGLVLMAGLWLLACRPVANLFLLPLEGTYDQPTIAALRDQGIREVVVLSGGGYPTSGELSSSALPSASAQRLLGGLELCTRLGPECQLIVSGSAGRGRRDVTTASSMQDLARKLAPRLDVASEAQSGSTAEHPEHVRSLLAGAPFALVTSDYHMPRAMRSFERSGLEPVAYPVDSIARAGYRWTSFLPSLESLSKIQAAWREYLALALYSVLGW